MGRIVTRQTPKSNYPEKLAMPNETNIRVIYVGLHREVWYRGRVKVAVPKHLTDSEVEELMNDLACAVGQDAETTQQYVTLVKGN
jgi:hypothetical protein